ncbi:hypothetical protein [Xanthomonas tesorieronis]|uniref:hypothetical protein n=1 Tax=Xanthomonas tesorieronis TaxID=3160839 RepID=UPI0035148F0E
MNISFGKSLNVYCKAGLVLVAVAALLFLTGLAKGPAPSDGIRIFLVAGLSLTGVIFYVVGMIISAWRK